MSPSKPLIIPWLRGQIDSGRYPGVCWTNQEHTQFCIPWKHALRQDSSVDDSLIFKAWAEVSGGQAHGDASIWKRNFRSALRAKGFHMLADNKKDAANPHKVFLWPEGAAATGGPREPEEPEPDLYQEPLPVQESQGGGFNADLHFPADQLVFAAEISPDDNQDILERCLHGLNIEPSKGVLEESVLPGQQPTYTVMEGAVGGVELPGQPANPGHGAVGVAREQQVVEQLVNTMSSTMHRDTLNTHFRLAVYYRGAKVWEQLLENEAGFRLVYMPDLPQPTVDAESGLSLVSLPRVGPVSDQQQAHLTQLILDSLGDGLEVRVLGNVVYGWRRGKSQAFWSLCKFHQSRTPQEVSKTALQPLYQTKDFVAGLLDFIKGGGQSPPFSLFFCLGEKWPDPNNKPWEKKLVVVEVVLTVLEMLKMVAVDGGASSLQSVELQMSLEESLQELLMELG